MESKMDSIEDLLKKAVDPKTSMHFVPHNGDLYRCIVPLLGNDEILLKDYETIRLLQHFYFNFFKIESISNVYNKYLSRGVDPHFIQLFISIVNNIKKNQDVTLKSITLEAISWNNDLNFILGTYLKVRESVQLPNGKIMNREPLFLKANHRNPIKWNSYLYMSIENGGGPLVTLPMVIQ
ncbi:hypothetical protein PPL_10773 [Heterostelium album PN500]|uniref:Uncharacterized protein n=1 Tax=Heterostelium pallidum (strain ATCC 26659 / Pp 5 / PN500) TaxID=670386 RepID=D3BRY3_HETP5|nr:hypothetical protein PPL_10773 [Heterostelium album PN500]EFA75720.1 hypothetical protein PPL_10773 [Heterostelium album PN500]|eukprot:XP_020427854.1 hypothetical protein PPL_10773 [Heterostelium album PN500]